MIFEIDETMTSLGSLLCGYNCTKSTELLLDIVSSECLG
jgi:hypothetical protein